MLSIGTTFEGRFRVDREALVGATIESDHVIEVLDRGDDMEQRVGRQGALPPGSG